MRIAGVVLLIGIFSLFINEAALNYVDPYAIVLVLGGVAALLLLTQPRQVWTAFIQFASFRGKALDEDAREDLAGFFQTGSRSALAFGLIGQMLSLIRMLMNMADPSSIGPAIAISIISLLYGILLSELVFVPMHRNVTRTLPREKKRSIPLTGLMLVLITSLFEMSAFYVVLLSMSHLN